jgi:hypothetical protein
MMVPLERKQQSEGGTNRVKNQSPADQKFLGMLAASRRPLSHDAPVTPEGLMRDLKELAEMRQWIYLGIVGADLRTIRHDLGAEKITRRLKEVGGAIGLLGITAFGTPGNRVSLQVFYRPLKKGSQIIEKLDKVGRELLAVILKTLEYKGVS